MFKYFILVPPLSSKDASSNKNILQNILSELQHLRQDVSRATQLLYEIAQHPIKIGHCWYHKRRAIATNPENCPGPRSCTWN